MIRVEALVRQNSIYVSLDFCEVIVWQNLALYHSFEPTLFELSFIIHFFSSFMHRKNGRRILQPLPRKGACLFSPLYS
jgi:hypothetical protein